MKEYYELSENYNITGYEYINENKILFLYEHKDLDKTVKKPSYLGAYILSYSKLIMDFYLNKINAYYDKENLPMYTDTDSIIVKNHCVDILKEYFKPG